MTDVDPRARQILLDYAARHGRPLSWGHSTVAHRDLGYCSACVREAGKENDGDYELNGWRLLAMAERGMAERPHAKVAAT